MANQIYPSWLEHMLDVYFNADDHWTTNPMNLYVCGLREEYNFHPAHATVEDLGINVVLAPRLLEEVTTIDGVLKAADMDSIVTDEEAGARVLSMVIFAANDDGSRLLAHITEGAEHQLPMRIVEGVLKLYWNPLGILRI